MKLLRLIAILPVSVLLCSAGNEVTVYELKKATYKLIVDVQKLKKEIHGIRRDTKKNASLPKVPRKTRPVSTKPQAISVTQTTKQQAQKEERSKYEDFIGQFVSRNQILLDKIKDK